MLCMIKISQTSPAMLNSRFYTFSNEAVRGVHKDTNYVVSQLKQYEKQYRRLGIVDVFCERASKLADGLAQSGQRDFAGMIYSNLLKLPMLKPHFREQIAKRALEVAVVQGDFVHALARLVDLKMLYKDAGMKKQYVDILLQEEKLLKKIIKDYPSSKLRFKSVARKIQPIDTYTLKMAMTKVDIAKSIMRREPNVALTRLYAAREIFVEYNRIKEVNFVDKLIYQIAS